MLVYVFDLKGFPLMPCSPAKARLLLKEGKAKVVKRTPFTIKLVFPSHRFVQPVTLGVDKGAKETGISCVGNGKVLFSAVIRHRTDVKEKMEARAALRRCRRNRKWYRKPRFLNRGSSRRKGKLAPSIRTNVEEVFRVATRIPLPITHVVIEDVQVDIARLNNPTLCGREYQEATRLDENLRLATILRDKCKCKVCNKAGVKLEAHHIVFRSEGGKDTLSNLITLCSSCHTKVHSGKIKIKGGVSGKLDQIAQHAMIGKSHLYSKMEGFFGSLSLQYGYQTSSVRKYLNLPKEHDIDAFCLASIHGGLGKFVYSRENFYNVKFRLRQTRKQYHSLPRKVLGRVRYQVNSELEGFRKGDIVLVNGKFIKQVNSIYSTGTLAFARVKGEPSTAKPRHCRILEKQKTIIWAKAS